MAKAKKKSIFFCKECGFESAKWLGQCPGCKEWNSFVEEPVIKNTAGKEVPVSYTHLLLNMHATVRRSVLQKQLQVSAGQT